MARTEIASQAWGVVLTDSSPGRFLRPAKDQTVTITNLDGSPATTWSAVTGGTSSTASLLTNSDGEIPRYIEGGTYLLSVGDEPGRRVDAVSGSVETSVPLNVTQSPYSALPGVTADCYTGFQAAVDAANANYTAGNGPTEVYVPPGTYTFDLHADPGGHTIAAMFFMRSGVTLRMAEGAILKLKDGAVLPGGMTQGHLVSCYKPYATANVDQKDRVRVFGGTIDGNSDNQTLDAGVPRVAHGLFFGSGTSMVAMLVKVRRLRGTTNFPPGETMHFEANHCSGFAFISCEADGSGATDTASGFSADDSFDGEWNGCKAHDLSHGQGFTSWQCANLRYVGGAAWSCPGGAGLNVERADGVTITGGNYGGRSPLIGNGDPEFATWPSGQVSLPNATGIALRGCSDVTIQGAVGDYNATNGLVIAGNRGVTRTATVTSGSSTLTAAAGGAWKAGEPIAGAGIPALTYVGVYSSGAATITLVDSTGAAVLATATATGVVLSRPCVNVTAFGGEFLFTVAGQSANVYVERTGDFAGACDQYADADHHHHHRRRRRQPPARPRRDHPRRHPAPQVPAPGRARQPRRRRTGHARGHRAVRHDDPQNPARPVRLDPRPRTHRPSFLRRRR
jgi:hypothetical protein